MRTLQWWASNRAQFDHILGFLSDLLTKSLNRHE
jgi:hypothetical protein